MICSTVVEEKHPGTGSDIYWKESGLSLQLSRAGGSLSPEVADSGAAGATVQAVLKGWRDASADKELATEV